jgi:hypothetical protein
MLTERPMSPGHSPEPLSVSDGVQGLDSVLAYHETARRRVETLGPARLGPVARGLVLVLRLYVIVMVAVVALNVFAATH